MQIPEGYKLVPIWAIRMLKYDGYLERWFYHLQDETTQLEAYYKTEEDFKRYFEMNRYKTFKSFREVTYQVRRKKINKSA